MGAALALYALFFALLFLPMARAGRLPGNCDTWLNGIAIPNLVLARAEAALTGGEIGTPLYPERNVLGYGESSIGTSLLFIACKLLTGDDVRAYYPFAVLVLALDGLGAYLLASWYVQSAAAAFFAGLAFAASNYTLGNLDSPHTSFFFVALLCLSELKRHLETGSRRALIAAAVLGGAQVYFSAYVFFFLFLMGSALFVAHAFRRRGEVARELPRLGVAGLVSACLALPFFAFYYRVSEGPNFANPWDLTFIAEVHSLEPSDLLRTLENNVYPLDRMIYARDVARRTEGMIQAGLLKLEDLTNPDSTTVLGTVSSPDDPKYFVYTRRCAFLGVALYTLAALGLIRGPASGRSGRWELAGVYLVALVLALGPVIWVGDVMFANVTLPLYRWGLASPLRIPARAFSFAALAVALLAGIGLERTLGSRKLAANRAGRCAVYVVLTLVVLVENVPYPVKSFEGSKLATPEPLVVDFFTGRSGLVILDLPSRPGGALFHDSDDLFEWNREILYMNYQTYHRQSTVNGVHGYFPRSRLEVQQLVNALPSEEALEALREVGVSYIVYHRDLELPWEAGIEFELAGSEKLVAVARSRDVTVFAWRPARREP